jgi:MGT family glycosyltransferase
MEMPLLHVAFCIAPFSGHVNPSLALVSELAQRGHRVSYVTTDEFSEAVRGAGGRPVVLRIAGPPSDGQAASADPDRSMVGFDAAGHDFARSLGGQLRELKATLPVLISAYAQGTPDVVVCDPMCWAGRALAARWGARPINSVTTMIGKPRWSLGPVGASIDPANPALPKLLAATSAVLARYETGLTANHLLGADGGIPAIAFHPRAFEAEGDQFGPDVHFVGPCLPRQRGAPWQRGSPGGGPGDDLPWRPPGDGPVVLVSLGTVFNRNPALFRRCIDALAELRCHVVAALGGMDASTLGPLPSNAQVHEYVPLPEVLRHADVFVSHAGMTSSMEALSFGVPIVALPQIPEQRLNADRVAELGLGICLEPAALTADGLRLAVTTLMHDVSIGSRLAWMRAEIERAPGALRAAQVIENML